MSIYPNTNQVLFLELDFHHFLDAVLCYYHIKDNRLIVTINNNGIIEEVKDYKVDLSYSKFRAFLHFLCIKRLPTIKETLHEPIKKIYQEYKPMFCYGIFRGSDVFSKSEFNLIVKEFNDIPEKNKNEARKNITTFIEFLEENNFNPIPTGYTETSWVAKCPKSDGKHFMSISTTNDEWGCGYCQRKGNRQDLINWFKEIEQLKRQREDQNQLSNILKNKSDESTMKWWMNRY